jgi:hypothetical protein
MPDLLSRDHTAIPTILAWHRATMLTMEKPINLLRLTLFWHQTDCKSQASPVTGQMSNNDILCLGLPTDPNGRLTSCAWNKFCMNDPCNYFKPVNRGNRKKDQRVLIEALLSLAFPAASLTISCSFESTDKTSLPDSGKATFDRPNGELL